MKKVLHAFGSIKLFNVVIRLFEFISSFAKCMKDFFILFFLTLLMDIVLISKFILISMSNEGKVFFHSKFLKDCTKLTGQNKRKSLTARS